MPTVILKPDTLYTEHRAFAHASLHQPLFLNSVPKSGSHLLRNIIRMFVPVEQHYQAQFIQWMNLAEHRAAFDPRQGCLSWGHMLFTDITAAELAGVRHILLVRDPYNLVLARARFFLSNEWVGRPEPFQQARIGAAALLNMMIFGIHEKLPPLAEAYEFNAVSWLGTGVHLVRYEDLAGAVGALESEGAESWFASLLEACGITMPADWRERVRIGADRNHSGTARENLTGTMIPIPDELPAMQKRLVDHAAPGLRALLGYA